jgi:hypothetical protein
MAPQQSVMRGGSVSAAGGSRAGAGTNAGIRTAFQPAAAPALLHILLPASGRVLTAAPSEPLAAAVERAAAAYGLPADSVIFFAGGRPLVASVASLTLGEAAAGCGDHMRFRLRLSSRAKGGGCSSSRVDGFPSEEAGLSDPPPIGAVRFVSTEAIGSSSVRTAEQGGEGKDLQEASVQKKLPVRALPELHSSLPSPCLSESRAYRRSYRRAPAGGPCLRPSAH